MIDFVNFFKDKENMRIINDALIFTTEFIRDHYKKIVPTVKSQLRKLIWAEYSIKVVPILDAKKFFNENIDKTFILMEENFHNSVMNLVASSLMVYRKHIDQMSKSTGLKTFIELTQKIDKILIFEGPRTAKKDIFDEYYPKSKNVINQIKGTTEFFISYQKQDQKTAGEIKKLLVKNSELTKENVFIAHRDIKVSKKWREEIIQHLESCTHFIALCTENYETSTWSNQETGYALAKGVKIIPIFWKDVKKGNFGFLESIQSLSQNLSEDNFEKVINEILESFKLKI